jgi:hypothetical protein
MRKWLSMTLAASLLMNPFATYAEDYGSQTSQAQEVPPVAQTLVREGDFAIKLAAVLDLGLPTDEAVAEDMLVKAGVAPANGWISDYPVTPQIVGQLQDSIAKAAAAGKLPMSTEEATKGLYSLAAQMKLPVPAGAETAAKESEQVPVAQSDQTVINNYYYDEGPPIITYYPPPVYFGYLYDWVPYPVWWFGFWFPGFYICHNFTTTVVVGRTPFVTRRAIVSNQIIDPVTRRVAVVDPVVRTSTGSVRPETTLRTENGRMFRTVTDFRHGVSVGGFNAGRPGTAANRTPRTEGFRSPQARTSAQAIYSRSADRMSTRTVRQGTMSRGGDRAYVSPRGPGRSYNGPSRGGGARRYVAPGSSERSYRPSVMRPYTATSQPERSYYSPSWGGQRRYIAPNVPARPFNSPEIRGGGPTRWFPTGGWHGR